MMKHLQLSQFFTCPPPQKKPSVEWLHSSMFALVTSLCLASSGADIELDWCLNDQCIHYSQYLNDLKQYSAQIGSESNITRVYGDN